MFNSEASQSQIIWLTEFLVGNICRGNVVIKFKAKQILTIVDTRVFGKLFNKSGSIKSPNALYPQYLKKMKEKKQKKRFFSIWRKKKKLATSGHLFLGVGLNRFFFLKIIFFSKNIFFFTTNLLLFFNKKKKIKQICCEKKNVFQKNA